MDPEGALIRASAPARVDLAGGTLDIWPVYLLVERATTVNAAIALRAHAEISLCGAAEHHAVARDLGREARIPAGETGGPGEAPRSASALPLHEAILRHRAPGRPLRVVTWSDVPAGSGLGGSSSLAVALLAGLARLGGEAIDGAEIVRVAADLEARVIETLTGTQDHLAALHGGVAAIGYGPGGATRRTLPVAPRDLESRGVLAFLGASRASARANWDMLRRALDGDGATRRGLAAVAEIAGRMERALLRGDLDGAARLLGAEWEERRGLSPEVTTPETEIALRAARAAGALGGKICGAGGGGALFVMGEPGARDRIDRALRDLGCRILEFRLDTTGLAVEGGDLTSPAPS